MASHNVDGASFSQIRNRLDEIATQVRGDDLPLDAALDLYDEAVKLGMKATELLESIDDAAEGDAETKPADSAATSTEEAAAAAGN